MAPPPSTFAQRIDASLATAFQKDLLRCVMGAYQTAEEELRNRYSYHVAHDLRGHLRRADLDTNLEILAGRYPGVTVSHEPNGKGNCYHLQMSINGVVLTASAVHSPTEFPRDAKFRSTLARNPQLTFSFGPHRQPPAEDDPLFVLLLHGPAENDRAMPGFVHLTVPDEDCRVYLGRIDLFARFATIPELRPVTQVETIKSEMSLRVRRPRTEDTGA